jgi:pSer/pThr/pTyr-binding forkhead associated (FHA) protein
MPFALRVIAGDRKGEIFRLPEDRAFIIGRDARNDIRLRDRNLSRIHCQIEVIGGRCRITDLSSRNGTLVRGVRIEEETDLHPDDPIDIGTNSLLFIELPSAKPKTPKPKPEERAPLKDEPGEGPTRCEECGKVIPFQDLLSENARTVGTRHYCSNCAASFG